MIIGEYPCCGASLMIELPDVPLPTFAPENCPECGAKVWHMFSRIDPKTWAEEGFLEEYDINKEAKTITKKVTD